MSTLSVTTIITPNDTTDATVTTSNTSAGKLVISASGGIVLASNSTVNAITVSANGNATFLDPSFVDATFSGNATFSGKIGVSNTAPETTLQISGNYGIVSNTLSAGNNHNVNCAIGNYFVITCNSSAHLVSFTSTPSNTVYSMTLRFANGSGGNTITWANTPKWPNATAPTPSTNNDIWIFITDDGGTTWRGNLVQRDSR